MILLDFVMLKLFGVVEFRYCYKYLLWVIIFCYNFVIKCRIVFLIC